MTMVHFSIGCGGWSYEDWHGRFYPADIRAQDLLRYYSMRMDTVEVNMTFYRFPTSRAVHGWYANTPDHFVFSVKMNRVITHYRRLRDVTRFVDSFMNTTSALAEKRGPTLIQLPPDLPPDHALLDNFLGTLPPSGPYAIEFRDRHWHSARTFRLLERTDVAVVITDPPAPRSDIPATADFCYVRWHGRSGPGSDYSTKELEQWAELLQRLPVDEVNGYFNNDVGGRAPRNALALKNILGI